MALHKWLDKHILSAEHESDLERDSAAHEFGAARLGRKEAEEAAYKAYRMKHHGAAIKHHLSGLRKAKANSLPEEADKHAALYKLHMKALGLRDGAMPPPSDEHDLYAEDKHYGGFRAHPADGLLVK